MWETHGSASTESVVFCCGKTAAAALFVGLLQLFVFFGLPPPAGLPRDMHSAIQLNIAYGCRMVIR